MRMRALKLDTCIINSFAKSVAVGSFCRFSPIIARIACYAILIPLKNITSSSKTTQNKYKIQQMSTRLLEEVNEI